jgi:AraC-like DNA-binding protein
LGYWLDRQNTQELIAGTVLILGQSATGAIRASQLGQLQLDVFRVEPERLTGLLTLGEQLSLRATLGREAFSCRILPPSDWLAEQYQRLCAEAVGSHFAARVGMLQIFANLFEEELRQARPEPAPGNDARQRLSELLRQTPASAILDLSLGELVENTRCTARHLSRVFHEVTGMSFREKKAQMRLNKACELLTGTDWKISEVALESGYPSVGVLNLAFKQRFGTSPAKWREQQHGSKRSRRHISSSQPARAALRVGVVERPLQTSAV